MTALIVALFVWAIAAFMASDGQVRRDEKRALMFFVLLGLALTAVGFIDPEKVDQARVMLS